MIFDRARQKNMTFRGRSNRIIFLLGTLLCLILAGAAASAQDENDAERSLSYSANGVMSENKAKAPVVKKMSEPISSEKKKYYKRAENRPGKIESKAEYYRRMKSTKEENKNQSEMEQFQRREGRGNDDNSRQLVDDGEEEKNNSRYSTSTKLNQDERRLHYSWWWGYRKQRRWGRHNSWSSSSSSSKKWGRRHSWGYNRYWRPWWYSW